MQGLSLFPVHMPFVAGARQERPPIERRSEPFCLVGRLVRAGRGLAEGAPLERTHGVALAPHEKRMLVVATRVEDTYEKARQTALPGHDEFWKFLGPYGWSRGYMGEDGKPAKPGLIPTLDESIERGILEEALGELEGIVEYEILTQNASLGRIRKRLRDERFNVLHIVGHGAFVEESQKGVPWFGIVVSTVVASALMAWSYSGETGLKVFTYLVYLSVVTVAIPYFFSACAQLSYLVSRRRPVQGWALARDLTIACAGGLFSLWVTFSSGYQSVYQAMLLILLGLPLYAFLKARRERLGQVDEPVDMPAELVEAR